MPRDQLSLTALARAGFSDLGSVRERLDELTDRAGITAEDALGYFSFAADPDEALRAALALLRQAPDSVLPLLRDQETTKRLLRVLGASQGLAEFFMRQPAELAVLNEPVTVLPTAEEFQSDLLESVGAVDGVARLTEESAWNALRVR